MAKKEFDDIVEKYGLDILKTLFEITTPIDFSNPQQIMLKEDGSLISSYIHNDELRLKSKGSISSEQASDALIWLQKKENKKYHDEIEQITKLGHTVNFEWTAPQNRIVIGYQEENLVVLNVRNNTTGEYIDFEFLGPFPQLIKHEVTDFVDYINQCYTDMNAFVSQIKDEKNIEGYVIRTKSGQMVKIKTDWYLALHHVKDSISSKKRLFEAIINDAVDDALSMFHDDELLVKQINDMIQVVEPKFNHIIKSVNDFHKENKDLDRKSYAIKAQELKDGLMPLYMNMYTGKENDYKIFALKHSEMFINE